MPQNERKYKQELDGIIASAEFKERTRQLLAKQLEEKAGEEAVSKTGAGQLQGKALRFPARRLAAAACAVLVVAGSLVAARMLSPMSGGEMQKRVLSGEAQSTLAASAVAPEAEFAPEEEGVAADVAPFAAATGDAKINSAYFTPQTAEAAMARGTLPLLPRGGLLVDGMGFQGVQLYDIEAYRNDWPWNPEGEQPATLPVYQNIQRGNRDGSSENGLPPEELEDLVWEQAAALGVAVGEVSPVNGYPGAVTAQGAGVEITAYDNADIHITLEDGYLSATGPAPAGDADMEAHTAWLQAVTEEYAALFAGMEDPVAITSLHYNFYGEPTWEYMVYDGGGDLANTIVNRSLVTATPYTAEDGGLGGFWLRRANLSELVGEYPLISEQEARGQLAAGNGLTTVPGDFPGEEYIAKVDLVYYASRYAGYFMPYYEYYVLAPAGTEAAAPEDSPQGQETYGIWYVPAVSPEYLTLPTEAGAYFN